MKHVTNLSDDVLGKQLRKVADRLEDGGWVHTVEEAARRLMDDPVLCTSNECSHIFGMHGGGGGRCRVSRCDCEEWKEER